jgi:hypothetical protein
VNVNLSEFIPRSLLRRKIDNAKSVIPSTLEPGIQASPTWNPGRNIRSGVKPAIAKLDQSTLKIRYAPVDMYRKIADYERNSAA